MNLPKGRISSLGQQFMPITQLHDLQSGDFPNLKVGDVVGPDGQDHLSDDGGYAMDALRNDVAEHGLKEPLVVQNGVLRNGHHRASVATDLGHMFVQHTHEMPSQWMPTDFRNKGNRPRPNRTWEPLIQEHENEANEPRPQSPQTEGQQQLFQTRFTDRRTRGQS